jgi:glycosyltransferase involved in cell wall biosynthesis
MDKISVVISCPIDTYSGYGARARDLVKALLKLEKYDVKVLSQRWGNTRFGYLKDHNEYELTSLIVPNLTTRPNVWIQLTVPNEFQPVGEYNIGITAGIETTICDPSWIEGLNRMNLNLVSSQHAKETFERSQFNVEEKGQVKGQIKLQKPIEVLFEGADLAKYFPNTSKFDLSAVKEDFAYLFVGHWLQGNFGQDRKNVGYMIKVFLEVFKNKKNQPALILKTQSANASILDRDQLLKKIDDIRKTVKGTLPNIYLIHGEMSDEEINHLYNHPKVKAMVSFTKGEGFGRPLLEFSLVNKPIIASNWSGHIDFLDKEFCYLINGTLTNVDKSAVVEKMILKESQWFTPNDTEAATALRLVYDNYKKYAELAKRQGYKSRTNFSWEKMAEQLDQILSSNLPEFAKQVELKLPTLQLPKLQKADEMPKLNLPKLNKING